MHQPLIESEQLKCLAPQLEDSVLRDLEARREKRPELAKSDVESYSCEVFSCVVELDSALESLALVRRFIEQLKTSAIPDLEEFRYHHENFVFRGTGLVDRAFQLAAAALRMSGKVRKDNQKIMAGVEPKSGEHLALNALIEAMRPYRKLRNLITHAEAYSEKRLGTLVAMRALNLTWEDGAHEAVTADLLDTSLGEIDQATTALHKAVLGLLEALGPSIRSNHASLLDTTLLGHQPASR